MKHIFQLQGQIYKGNPYTHIKFGRNLLTNDLFYSVHKCQRKGSGHIVAHLGIDFIGQNPYFKNGGEIDKSNT